MPIPTAPQEQNKVWVFKKGFVTHSLSLTHTHTHSHTLSLSHTHTHSLSHTPLFSGDICYFCSWVYFTEVITGYDHGVLNENFRMYTTKDFILNAHKEKFYSSFLNIFSFDNYVKPLIAPYCLIFTKAYILHIQCSWFNLLDPLDMKMCSFIIYITLFNF